MDGDWGTGVGWGGKTGSRYVGYFSFGKKPPGARPYGAISKRRGSFRGRGGAGHSCAGSAGGRGDY